MTVREVAGVAVGYLLVFLGEAVVQRATKGAVRARKNRRRGWADRRQCPLGR